MYVQETVCNFINLIGTVCVCVTMYHLLETGEDETFGDKLRSILAQMDFKYIIRSWDEGPFRTCMYVPEIHPILSKEFHEHEDEGHVFKVCNYF